MYRPAAWLVLLGLLWPAAAPAQNVKLPAELKGLPGIPLPVVAEADGANVVWLTPDPGLVVIDGGFFKGDAKRALLFGPAGRYRLWALTAKGDVVSPRAECLVTIGDAPPPVPPGPVPPGPTPPGPAPIPGEGFRVLIIEETAERAKLPAKQYAVLFAKPLYDYLRAKCAAEPAFEEGKAFAVWDKDAPLDAAPKLWQDAVARAKAAAGFKTPWLLVSTGKAGYSGPLPGTLEETLTLLKKYGGD